jgi:hypothetical protein
VTQFAVTESYLANFEPHSVGSSIHVEYWIPAEQLSEFNASIRGLINVETAYFGDGFKGCVPDDFGLKGKDAVSQFVTMLKMLEYSTFDFVCGVSANRKAVYLNFLFWAQFDFTPLGLGDAEGCSHQEIQGGVALQSHRNTASRGSVTQDLPSVTCSSSPHPVGSLDAMSRPTLQTVSREAKSKPVHFAGWHIPVG